MRLAQDISVVAVAHSFNLANLHEFKTASWSSHVQKFCNILSEGLINVPVN